MPPRAPFFAVLSALLLAPGCAGGGGEEAPGDPSTDPVAGRYEVTSTYDLSASEVVPELVGDALRPLTGLSEDPAGTLIEILQASDSEVIRDLLDAIPDSLMGAFEDAVNSFIAEQIAQGGTGGDIVLWTDDLAGLLTRFDVVTHLDVGLSDEAGWTYATHTLAAVAFELRGERRVVDTPELVDVLTVARDVECEIALEGEGEGRIAIGDHAFHLPLGDFAVTAFNEGLQETLGVSDLRSALATVIDCAALAEDVASTCLGPVCVGNQTEIEAFCDAGLDQVAAEVEARIASIDFAELRLATGQASLQDAGKEDGVRDGLVDRMEDGAWETDVNVDGVVVPVPATFFAERLEPAGGAAE